MMIRSRREAKTQAEKMMMTFEDLKSI